MKNCKCDTCNYCSSYWCKTRKAFHCKHPNQKQIYEYFSKNNISKMPAFIGFGENFANVPKNKTTPKWCPELQKKE